MLDPGLLEIFTLQSPPLLKQISCSFISIQQPITEYVQEVRNHSNCLLYFCSSKLIWCWVFLAYFWPVYIFMSFVFLSLFEFDKHILAHNISWALLVESVGMVFLSFRNLWSYLNSKFYKQCKFCGSWIATSGNILVGLYLLQNFILQAY